MPHELFDRFGNYPLVEGVVTTTNEDGTTKVSPMGPRVDWPTTELLLRPYPTSTTYQNLRRTGRGILHITDDVLLIARAAIGRLETEPQFTDGPDGWGRRLVDCVRWYAFETAEIDDSGEPVKIAAKVVHEGSVRDFFGFHRARHAVIEGAILATRLHLIPLDDVLDDYARLATIVDKTAGPAERQAFALLQSYVAEQAGEAETKNQGLE